MGDVVVAFLLLDVNDDSILSVGLFEFDLSLEGPCAGGGGKKDEVAVRSGDPVAGDLC